MNPDGECGAAFVVWLDRADGTECCGHVERVSTAERVRFASAAELIAVITQASSGGVDRAAGGATEEP